MSVIPSDVTSLALWLTQASAAVPPAWSMDGSRLAWAQKAGRRRYTLMIATVDHQPQDRKPE